MTDKFTEFQKAYDSYPSQDQEGYVPDQRMTRSRLLDESINFTRSI